jgi:Family of unknown function (DUF6220)
VARTIHKGLSHLFGGLLVIQFFLAGLGAFTTVHNKKFKDSNFDPHAALGTLMVLLALIVLLVALFGKPGGDARRFSAIIFGLMVVQLLLAGFGADTAAWIGGLHAVNAVAITGVTVMLIRDSRAPGTATPPAVAA